LHTLFFFHAPPPTVLYTFSLHDALPIWKLPLHRIATKFGLVGLHRDPQKSSGLPKTMQSNDKHSSIPRFPQMQGCCISMLDSANISPPWKSGWQIYV